MDLDIRAIAQKLIDELGAEESRRKQQAEGVALLYNRLLEESKKNAPEEKKQEAVEVKQA